MSNRTLYPAFEQWYERTRCSCSHGRRYMDADPDSNGGWVVFMAFRYAYYLGRRHERSSPQEKSA